MCIYEYDHWKCKHETLIKFTPCAESKRGYVCKESTNNAPDKQDVMCSECKYQEEEAKKKTAEAKAGGGISEGFSQLDL